jgi:hypothetical protein
MPTPSINPVLDPGGATTFHVFGPARIDVVVTGVTGGPLQRLGYTEEGGTVALVSGYEDVMADFAGGFIPGDVQYMGQIANIVCPFVTWDNTYMNAFLAGIAGATPGLILAKDLGRLMLASNGKFGLKITPDLQVRNGAGAEPSWFFPCVYITSEVPMRLGTKVTRAPLTAKALPFGTGTGTTAGGVLYQRGT